MRRIAFSFIAALVTSCGPKPPSATTGAPPEDVRVAEVSRRVPLQPPARPLGKNLKISVTAGGDIYVLDPDHNRILQYGLDGTPQREVGGLGDGPSEFSSPVDFDGDDLSLWVLDRQNQRLVRLDRRLNYIEELSLAPDPEDPSAPLWYDAVACAASGDLFLLDKREPRAVRLSASGEIVSSYGGFALGAGRLEVPVDLTADVNGSLYVADGKRLLQFDRAGNLKSTHSFAEPLAAVAAGDGQIWILHRGGALTVFKDGKATRVLVDPSLGTLQPVALAGGRNVGLAILDLELTVWLLAPFGR